MFELAVLNSVHRGSDMVEAKDFKLVLRNMDFRI